MRWISEIASDQGAANKAPSVGDDKECEFEWERYDNRRDHHHPHRHQDGSDGQINNQKRKKDKKSDLKSPFDLAQKERWNQQRKRRFGDDPKFRS